MERKMTDYISRADAIDAICKEWCYVTYGNCPHVDDGFICDGCDDIKALESLPSADAVEVVRCKNCIWFKQDSSPVGYGYCDGRMVGREVDYNDYCSYGKRREP